MRFEIFRKTWTETDGSLTPFGDWYWRLRARNGRIMADGGEGYATSAACRRAIHHICGTIIKRGSVPPIVEVES